MKPTFSIRLGVAILGLVMAESASACSCKQIGVENLVLDTRLALARIVVVPPTFTERVVSLFDLLRAGFSGSRTYPVKVLEVITGQYEATAITARASGSSDCGVDLRHGQTYYHLASPVAAGEPLQASVCNLVTEEYVRQVKAYKQRPKPELSPVPPGSWTEIFRDDKQTVHADYRGATSDAHGRYIWVLRNFIGDGRIKSEKSHLQIACKEQQYNVVSRHEFSEINARGDAVSSVNLSERGHYAWLSTKPDIEGLVQIVCRGPMKRSKS
jgi:hypothetical protein